MLPELLAREWLGDARVKGSPLMSNPFATLAFCLSYFVAVKAGVAAMRQRTAFSLRWPLIAYNCLLVALNVWIVFGGGRFGWFSRYKLSCAECDPEDSVENRGMIRVSYVFFLSKFVEMLDTMFFVLRKKNELLTKLHLVHHGLLPLSCWFTVKYVPGTSGARLLLSHVLIHAFVSRDSGPRNLHGLS